MMLLLQIRYAFSDNRKRIKNGGISNDKGRSNR